MEKVCRKCALKTSSRPLFNFGKKLKTATRLFYNTFISNARLKLAKNQANTKQHPEAKLLLFQNY